MTQQQTTGDNRVPLQVWDGYAYRDVVEDHGREMTLRHGELVYRVRKTEVVPVGEAGFPLSAWPTDADPLAEAVETAAIIYGAFGW